MKNITSFVKALLTLILLFPVIALYSQTKVAIVGPPPCNWEVTCTSLLLTQVSTYEWEGTFNFEAGTYYYKAVADGSWATSYPNGDNLQFTLTVAGPVHFTFNSQTKVIFSDHDVKVDPPPPPPVSKVAIVGPPPCNWEVTCTSLLLTQVSTYEWEGTFNFEAGTYYYKAVADGSWAISYPIGDNLQFTLAVAGPVHFIFNSQTKVIFSDHDVKVDPPPPPPPPVSKIVVVGSNYSSPFCGWDPTCATSQLTKTGPDTWTGTFTIPAGCWEYKVVEDGDWLKVYPTVDFPSLKLNRVTTGSVTFTYNSSTKVLSSDHDVLVCPPPQPKVVLAGTFQSELGCNNSWGGDWDPACNTTALTYNPVSGMFEGFLTLPAGCWAYKVALNDSWSENYGLNGMPGGLNIPLNVPAAGIVNFVYDPVSHIVTSSPYPSGVACPPETVVLPGNFQSELGCMGDWEPACNNTRLTYNPATKLWSGTFDVPAGNWEYKVAINNSWGENYGLNGLQDGPNIPLELCAPARITFSYNHITHLVELVATETAICISKYYDANVNGLRDYGEPALAGVSFTLSGSASAVQYTDALGTTSFTGLVPGTYTVTETLASGYVGTTPTTKTITPMLPVKMEFGNVCLGPGGGYSMGYWMSKTGQQVLNDFGGPDSELAGLRYLNLRNANGSSFDPWTFTQLKTWLSNANASNMAYMLSAQLATMYLNLEAGFIKGGWSALLYTPGTGNLGEGNFSNLWFLYSQCDMSLYSNAYTLAQHPERKYQEAFKNALDRANNNLNYVQSAPCAIQVPLLNRNSGETFTQQQHNQRIWPNPSNGAFNLRVITDKIKTLQVTVFDVNGRRLLSLNGATNNDINFGAALKPGVYLIEVICEGQRTIERVIKQ